MRSEIGPRFANEQQRRFFYSDAPELLYSGAFGAGKSRILCEKALDLGKRHPGAPIGIFRKVRASLSATTQITFLRDVCKPGDIVKRNLSEGWYELANGSRFWLLGLDADTTTHMPSKVGSLDLAYAFVDEAVEVTEDDWTMLLGRLRYPGVPWTQLAAATNPASPTHWLKQRFAPDSGVPVAGTHYEHATTFDNRFTKGQYHERMQGLTGARRALYAMGEWVALTGGLFESEWIVRSKPPQLYKEGALTDDLTRVVVAVDPAVTADKHSDETGIIVAGLAMDGRAYVLADRSGKYTPKGWADVVNAAFREFHADVVVAEVNNGGDLVAANLRSINTNLPVKSVTASRGKIVRAEPIARLYGERKVSHVEPFHELEAQMLAYDGQGQKSPDRLDALVWGLSDLMLYGNADTEKAWIA